MEKKEKVHGLPKEIEIMTDQRVLWASSKPVAAAATDFKKLLSAKFFTTVHFKIEKKLWRRSDSYQDCHF